VGVVRYSQILNIYLYYYSTGKKEKRTSNKNVDGRSTSSHNNKKFRSRSMEKQRGMAFGLRKTATAVKKPDIYIYIRIILKGLGPIPFQVCFIFLRFELLHKTSVYLQFSHPISMLNFELDILSKLHITCVVKANS